MFILLERQCYSFGGSYHRHEAYGSGSGSAYKLNNIDCSDSDVRLRDCDIDSYDQHNDANKHLGITCYTENMEGMEVPYVTASRLENKSI